MTEELRTLRVISKFNFYLFHQTFEIESINLNQNAFFMAIIQVKFGEKEFLEMRIL